MKVGDLAKFIGKLREGNELVQGCRLPSGGGTVLPGAMPFLHRHLGNPMFSLMARCWFRAPIHDVYCGMRGFTKALYERLDQQCTGMEFATEMIIKASLYRARIAEVPITLHPDGRKSHAPHLKTFRDGWRTLRFFLLFSPRWLFLLPGGLLILQPPYDMPSRWLATEHTWWTLAANRLGRTLPTWTLQPNYSEYCRSLPNWLDEVYRSASTRVDPL